MDDYQTKRAASGAYSLPENPRNTTALGAGQIAVTSIPQQISSVSSRKTATKLTNLSATEVFYGSSPGVTSATGDLLPAGRGQWVSIPSRSIIFVVCALGQSATISWAEAYDESPNFAASAPPSGTQTIAGTVIAKIEDTNGNTINADSAGDLRVNPNANTGSFKTVSVTPGAGIQPSLIVPAGKKWLLKSLLLTLITSATVATRRVVVAGQNATAASAFQCSTSTTQAAGQTFTYTFAPGMRDAAPGNFVSSPIPEMVLGPGDQVSTNIQSFQVGAPADQVSIFTANVFETPD